VVPFILNHCIDSSKIVSSMSEDAWLGFWGSYIGSIIGSIFTLIAIICTYNINKKNIVANRKAIEQNRKINEYKEIKIFLSKCILLMNSGNKFDSNLIYYAFEDYFMFFYNKFLELKSELVILETRHNQDDVLKVKVITPISEIFNNINEALTNKIEYEKNNVNKTGKFYFIELALAQTNDNLSKIEFIYRDFDSELKKMEQKYL
jgi:hypothetical protein